MGFKWPNRSYIFLISFIILETIFVLIIVFFISISNFSGIFGLFIVLAIAILLVGAIAVGWQIVYLVKDFEKYKSVEKELESYKLIVTELRAQRHDFQNHLAVISTLLQMGAYESAVKYMNNVTDQITGIFSLGSLKKPEIAALIAIKINEAYKYDIKVNLEISATLEDLKADVIDVTRILSNLLDNAITALADVDCKDRRLLVSIKENELYCTFTIANYRPIISDEIKDRIWENGFTTKNYGNSGLGLYIVRNLVQRNSGRIFMESDETTGTVFKVIFYNA